MAGYNSFSMSNNAVSAYENGEKPLSKWGKAELVSALKTLNSNADAVTAASRLTVAEIRRELLTNTGWHHTSAKFNRTNFYTVDESASEELTVEKINEIIAARPPKATHTEKSVPAFITAYVTFDVWDKNRFGRVTGKHEQREAVQYRDGEKLVKTSDGVKRLSSLKTLYTVNQKTKYANQETVIKKYNNKIQGGKKWNYQNLS